MTDRSIRLSRRETMGLLGAAAAFSSAASLAETGPVNKRAIPKSGESISMIGLGSSRTFDVGDDEAALDELTPVMQAFFDKGGTVIDSSPMYGTSESVIGELLRRVTGADDIFAATKVWTEGKEDGIAQMQESMQRMGVAVMDLMQVHNLVGWQTQIETLKTWKDGGKIRYIGITTSHGRMHDEFERVMKAEPIDFVQFTYNILDRKAEERLLPLAADLGQATMINVPFQRGALLRKVAGKPLPDWAAEFDCASWGQFFLKFVASHPAVTCIIPATTKLSHMNDNMGAGFGRLPDAAARARMIAAVEAL